MVGDPQNQLSSAGGLLSATQSSLRAWPSKMRSDEVFCRVPRALRREMQREREISELGETGVSLLLQSPHLFWGGNWQGPRRRPAKEAWTLSLELL